MNYLSTSTAFAFVFLATVLAGHTKPCGADIVFDFTPVPTDFSYEDGSQHRGFLTRGGITASLTGHSDSGLFTALGKVFLSGSGIGISIVDGTNNNESAIDLAMSDNFGDVNERLLLSFDTTVQFTGVTLSGLGIGNHAALIGDPESTEASLGDLIGTSNMLDTFDLTSANITLNAGDQIGIGHVSGAFQVTGFSVSAVPEPSSLLLVSLVAGAVLIRRKRE